MGWVLGTLHTALPSLLLRCYLLLDRLTEFRESQMHTVIVHMQNARSHMHTAAYSRISSSSSTLHSLTGHFKSLQLMLVLLVASLLPSAYGMAMSRQAVLAPFAARNAFKLISGTVD